MAKTKGGLGNPQTCTSERALLGTIPTLIVTALAGGCPRRTDCCVWGQGCEKEQGWSGGGGRPFSLVKLSLDLSPGPLENSLGNYPQASLCWGAIPGHRGGGRAYVGMCLCPGAVKKHSLCSVSWDDFREATLKTLVLNESGGWEGEESIHRFPSLLVEATGETCKALGKPEKGGRLLTLGV